MFVVVVFLEAEADARDKLHAALLANARNSLAIETGLMRFDVCEDTVDPQAFLLYEIYKDQAAHRMHLELPHYAEYRLLVDPWVKSRRILTYHLREVFVSPSAQNSLPRDEP